MYNERLLKWIRDGVRCFSRVRKADGKMIIGSQEEDLAEEFKFAFDAVL